MLGVLGGISQSSKLRLRFFQMGRNGGSETQ